MPPPPASTPNPHLYPCPSTTLLVTPTADRNSDMEKQPLTSDMDSGHKGPFDESDIPLHVGASSPRAKWSARSAARQAIRIIVLTWLFVLLSSWVKNMHRGWRSRRGQMGPWAFHQPTYTPATYSEAVYSVNSLDDQTTYLSSNATFPLNPWKTLNLDMPEGITGEVLISRIPQPEPVNGARRVVAVGGQVVVEVFYQESEGDWLVDAGLGMWSDMGSDRLEIKAVSELKSYHRIHLLLPPSTPVPSLSTNLPIRLSQSADANADAEYTFTSLTLSSEEGRNVTGKFNVTRSIEIDTITGSIDVDITVVPPPMPRCGRHGPPGHEHGHEHRHEHGHGHEHGNGEKEGQERVEWVEQVEEDGGRWWWPFPSSGRRSHNHDHPHGPPGHHDHDHPHGPPSHHRPHGPPPHGPHGPHGPPGHRGPPPPPVVIARSVTGSIKLRIHSPVLNITHPPHPHGPHHSDIKSGSENSTHSHNISIPVEIMTQTTTGDITIIDKTFLGLFSIGSVKGHRAIEVPADEKEIKIIREKVGERGGWLEGFVRPKHAEEDELRSEHDHPDGPHGHPHGPPPPPPPPPHGPHGHPHSPPPPHGPGGPHGPPGPPHRGPPSSPGPHGRPPPPPGLSRVQAHTTIGDIYLDF